MGMCGCIHVCLCVYMRVEVSLCVCFRQVRIYTFPSGPVNLLCLSFSLFSVPFLSISCHSHHDRRHHYSVPLT